MPVVRTVARSLGVRSGDYQIFLGWVDYHISLAMGHRPRAALRAERGAPLQIEPNVEEGVKKSLDPKTGILLSGAESQFHPRRPRRRDSLALNICPWVSKDGSNLNDQVFRLILLLHFGFF